MARSLTFIHLFIILTVGYIGGALLFRKMAPDSIGSILTYYDARIVLGQEASIFWPIGSFLLFFAIAFILSISSKTKFLILFIGAVKAVFFGISSSYLLGSGMKMMAYSIWWFPFQLVSVFLFLAYCAVLNPPYYTRPTFGRKRNSRALPTILIFSSLVFIVEMILFYWIAS